MVRKRLGNDIKITSKLSTPLTGAQDIRLEIRLRKHQKRYIPDFYSINGDTLTIEFKAEQQCLPGIYDLYLTYKIDDSISETGLSTYTADYCNLFELVESSCSLPDDANDIYFEWIIGYYNYDLLTEEQKDDIAKRTAQYIEGADLRAQYSIKMSAPDIQWDLDWIRIYPPETVSLQNKRVVPRSLQIFTSYGICSCASIVNYPEEIYSANGKYFRLKDKSNIINMETPFEYIIFDYDLVDDLEDRRNYDFIRKYNFGSNVILEEDNQSGTYEHGMQGRATFETLYPDFKGTHYMTLDPGFTPRGSIPDIDEAEVCERYGADIIIRPYYTETGDPLSRIENRYLNPDILKIMCHGDNEHRRVDVTPDEKTFLLNTVCVAAHVSSNPESGANTSYGFGLEFYENTRGTIWDDLYPDILHRSLLDVGVQNNLISEDRKTIYIYASRRLSQIKGVTPGAPIEVENTAGVVFPGIIESVQDYEYPGPVRGAINLVEPLEGYLWSTGQVYIWCPIGSVWSKFTGQSDYGSESFATNIVGTKFRIIKDRTGASWGICRHAARMTASLSTYDPVTGEYTTNWNMYQGFGIIDVEAAIAYIEANQNIPEFKGSNIINLPKTTDLVDFEDYKNNNYVAIKYLKNLFNFMMKDIQANTDVLNGYDFSSEYFQLTKRVYDKCWPIYESHGRGSWTPGLIKTQFPVTAGQEFTLCAYLRVVTALGSIPQYPSLRVIRKATGFPDIDTSEYMTALNTWEFLKMSFTVQNTGTLQMQIVQQLPVGAMLEAAHIFMCEGLIDNPIFIPKIEDIMNNKE